MASILDILSSNKILTLDELYATLNQNALLLSAILSSSAFIYYYTKYTYWSRRGIKTPIPIAPFGTAIWELFRTKNRALISWSKKYGRVYGVYQSVEPVLVVSDAQIVRDILVKDAHIFPNHKRIKFASKFTDNMLFFMRDNKWKELRSLMAFMLTSGKIKKMYNLMKSSSDDLIDSINKKIARGEAVDIKLTYGCFTLDVIARCAFAMKFDNEASEQKYRQELVSFLMKDMAKIPYARIFTYMMVPNFILNLVGFKITSEGLQLHLAAISRKIIKSRAKDNTQKRQDLLQLLIDLDRTSAISQANMIDVVEGDSSESHHVENYDKQELQDALREHNNELVGDQFKNLKEKTQVKLSDDEIIANCILFFIAGYETTSSLLSFATYSLACYPSVQEKLYEEVKSCIDRETQANPSDYFEYETVLSMRLLDAVISETLRMFPPAPTMDRQANEDYKIPSLNITIPAGGTVQVPFMSVHYDPEYYPEPNKFDPSRFLPENRHKLTPYTYLPFGAGIRHCLGMRFALAEAKLGLARLVYNYKFSPAKGPDAIFPPRLAKSFSLLRSDDLDVKLTKR